MDSLETKQYSFEIFDDVLLNLYNEQFNYDSFKSLISKKANNSNDTLQQLIAKLNSDDNDDPKLVVNLSDDMKEQYKNGTLCLDKDKEGNMYAQLRNNNKFGKKLTIKEDETKDLTIAAQIESIKDILIEIVDSLENIEKDINNILAGLHNDRVGLYYSGISLYLEALQVSDSNLKNQLVAQSLKSLNDSQAQLIQEFKSDIAFLHSSEYKNIKKHKHDCLIEKMTSINESYKTINRIITIKAMIYFDNNQFSSMMMVCKEYQRFIEAIIKPNKDFLIECDPRNDSLLDGVWSRRANTVLQLNEIQRKLNNTEHLSIKMEE